MTHAIMLTVETDTTQGIKTLLEAVECGYQIVSGVAVGPVIHYVLTGARELPQSVIKKAIVGAL